jgi:beta-glucanase (GH16 family)
MAATRSLRRGPGVAAGVLALALACALGTCQRAAGAPGPPAAGPPASGPLKKAPDGRPLSLTFADDFDSFRPFVGGKGIWRTTFGDGHRADFDQRTLRWNKEVQLYVDPDLIDAQGPMGLDPFAVHDGVLQITGARAPERLAKRLGGFAYTSGLISSQPSFNQLYGYFEMRAALPRGKGLWPAFWLLPADMSWPPEIDVMESIGDPSRVYVTAHSNAAKAQGIEAHTSGEGFHTYAVAWDAQTLVWYVDGAEAGRQPTPPDMHKPMYMLANLAMGGDWAGPPDATTPFPATYAIDFIRAYRFVP